jgi:hypothetical protein
MQITGMLYGSQLLKHVDFPATEVLGPGASEDEIQGLIDRHELIFIKPVFKGPSDQFVQVIRRQRLPCKKNKRIS